MQGVPIHLNFGRNVGGPERFLQLVFGVWLTRVVIRRHAEIHTSLYFRREQVRTIGFIGYQTAAVERRAGAYSIGQRRGRLHNERAAHAVTLGSDLLRLVHLLLRVEERNVSDGILLSIAGRVHRRHQRTELSHIGWILEIETGGVRERSFRNTIKGVGYENRISVGRKALADIAHRGPQTECVRPDQNARMGTGLRVNERGIAGSVGSLDFDVGFDDVRAGRGGGSCKARGHGESYKIAPRDVTG